MRLGLPRSYFQRGHSVVSQMSTTKALFPRFALSGGGRNWEARGDGVSSSLPVLSPPCPRPRGAGGSSRCCPAPGAPPPPSCAVCPQSGHWGPGFGKRAAEEGEITLQIPQAAGQAGMVSGRVLPSGWAACESRAGAEAAAGPGSAPPCVSVGLCWRQWGVAPCPSPVPGPRARSCPSGPEDRRDGPGRAFSPSCPRPRGPAWAAACPPARPRGKPSPRAVYPCLPGGPRPRGCPSRVVGDLVSLCCCAVGEGDGGRAARPGRGGGGRRWEMRPGESGHRRAESRA